MMRCCLNITGDESDQDQSREGDDIGESVMPTRKAVLQTVEKLFHSVTPFTPKNQKIDNNWLWKFYEVAKMDVAVRNKTEDDDEHVATICNMFNEMSTAQASRMSDKEGQQLQEASDNVVDGQRDDICEPTNNKNEEDRANKEKEEMKEDDKATETVLRSLSKLKKYKVNMKCKDDLVKVGKNMLGNNATEERHWKCAQEQRERDQIMAAVNHYLKITNKR